MPAYQYQQGDRPIEGYTIQYALGRGGFGEVYFALSDAGREVALKVVQHFEDIELRGIHHCMNLKSANLVTIFDVRFAADGTPWVIMEYVAGPSLREIIDESPQGLGTQRTAFLFRELAKGIAYLHNAGVVHRDLKPHNVFFEDGTVKIGDYSLSKLMTTSHRSGHTMTVGSVHYMAPEIGMGRYDKRVDIYALGVMLYEMLRGVPPYTGESMGEVLMKHLSSEPDVTAVPEPFASAIRKSMRRDPAERYQTAQEMAESLLDQSEIREQVQSFNPMTLSMIGERAGQLQTHRQHRTAILLADTYSSPAAFHDTRSLDDDSMLDAPPEPVGVLQQFGLWYTPSSITERQPDRMTQPVRLVVAVVATTLLSLTGSLLAGPFDALRPDAAEFIFLPLIHFSVSLVLSVCVLGLLRLDWGQGIWCGFELRLGGQRNARQRIRIGLATRAILVAAALAVLATAAVKADQLSQRNLVGFIAGLVLPLMLFDWRCFLAPHRHHRVQVRATLAVGLVAVIGSSLSTLNDEVHEWSTMIAAAAMSAAICVQLIAPLRRAKKRLEHVTADLPDQRADERSDVGRPFHPEQEIVR